MKTLAAVLVGINEPLEIQELTVPPLQSGQCLVRIKAAGICRTQLNEQAGLKGDDPHIPHLLGHEAAGYVEDIGSGVDKVRRGDYVVVSWIKGSGADAGGGKYTNGAGQLVQSGGAAVFTEYAVVSENRVVPIPQDIPADVAALLGCAIPTGVGVVLNTLRVGGGSIVVFGVGGIGGATVLAAQAAKCDPIIAVDVNEKALDLAQQLGATHVIHAAKEDSVAGIKKIVSLGADYAVEASGVAEVGEAAFASLNNQGVLAIAGHPQAGSFMRIDPFRLIEGRSIVGTWGGDVKLDRDIPTFANMYLDGVLAFDKLISKHFSLENIEGAMQALREGNPGRIVIDL